MTDLDAAACLGEPFTPDEIVAGRVPLATGEPPEEMAYRAAARALDCPRVCLVVIRSEGAVHYLAGLASAFASLAAETLPAPIAIALPGAAGHRGAGVYAAITPSGWAAVAIAHDGTVGVVAGDRTTVETCAALRELPLYEVDAIAAELGSERLPAWQPHHQASEAREAAGERLATIGGVVVAAAAAAVYIGLSIAGWHADEPVPQAISPAYAAPAGRLPDPQLALRTMRHLMEVSDLARQTRGTVRIYKVDRGRTSWAMELPAWVTRQQIEQLGGSPKVSAAPNGALVEGRL